MSVPALFVRNDDGTVTPTSLSRGPWDPNALHGGPVAALLAGIVDAHPALVPMVVSRLTVELLRPVPLAPLSVDATVLREGKRLQVLDITVSSGGTEVARCRALRQRRSVVPLPAAADEAGAGTIDAPPAPGPDELTRAAATWGLDGGEAYHSHAVDHRFASGGWEELGPVVDWTRLVVPVVAGEAVTAVQRVAAVADFGNGISAVLPFDDYVFINPDLTIHLFREPVGEWVCLDTVTRLGCLDGRTGPFTGSGVGMAESALSDERGRIGRSVQSLMIDRRPRR